MRKTTDELTELFGTSIPTHVFQIVAKPVEELSDDALNETLFFLSAHWRDSRVPMLLAVATAQYIASAQITREQFDALPDETRLQQQSFWTHVIVRMLVELDKLPPKTETVP